MVEVLPWTLIIGMEILKGDLTLIADRGMIVALELIRDQKKKSVYKANAELVKIGVQKMIGVTPN